MTSMNWDNETWRKHASPNNPNFNHPDLVNSHNEFMLAEYGGPNETNPAAHPALNHTPVRS